MQHYSKEQLARIVSALFIILGFLQINTGTDAEGLTNAIDALIVNGVLIISFAVDLYGYVRRFKKGDVTVVGRKK